MKPNELIDRIQVIRTANNSLWMRLLKLAFKHAPKEAAEIMQGITKNDAAINALSRELGEEESND